MKGYRDNGSAAGGFGARNKTVYDDVFGGPPKFGATTLPPRLEDYTEIFQGFHASRGSSIPVLDLPPPSNESDDVWFDVQSSKLDYSEVFGGFKGLDFAISYEELFNISKVGDGDSSDDLWTPAQSETLSDELDPYTSMEMNQQVSTTDPIEIFSEQLQNEPTFEAEKYVSNGIIYDSQFLDDPSEKENEKSFSLANNDHSSSNHGVVEGKQLQKSLSEPLDSVYKQHFSVCDLSLKTQPSNLPPPSRPPPVLSSKGDMDTFCLNPKLKTSKSYAFENMRGDRSPPYFDVEIDASSSSAAADAAAMKDAVEQAQAKLRSAKESMDRKKESLQNRSKITKGPIEKDRKHESIDENQQMKMKDVVESEPEKTCSPSQQIKTAIEVDESESYDNLIEIELKDNDMEPVVNKNEVKNENDSFEKEDEKELKESKAGPPEIVIVTQNDDDEEQERVVEDCYNWEENESDKISETASEKEQTLNHKEKISQKEDDQEALKHTLNEKTETINQTESTCSSEEKEEEEDTQKEHEREESEEEISEALIDEDEMLQNDLQDVKIEAPIENNNKRKEVNEKLMREREKENERIRKQEEERERQIEREKDRMERAFSETTKEKERAAVERATAEYKQRALAEARERLEKACAEARERSLAEKTMEGRMRVEKATAEARERAERSVMGGIRYPYNNGGESESPQRCKARLERHQRTADRAAKALAEKNMRDLLAQKEQTERNRLAEGLDAEVKRWCGGKQGNLRALLSTLQYILGPESGWQPIPLTEVITTVAVKKAYRKATLCVHPDKLQQRGATIQQKYICEKVFDLLKEAWNKFNSEER